MRRYRPSPLLSLTLILVLLASIGTLYGAWSFSRAKVTSSSSITVAKPEDALIGVRIDSRKEVIVGETTPCGTVTNNRATTTMVEATGGFQFSEQGEKAKSVLALAPGQSARVMAPTDRVGDFNLAEKIQATWFNGRAQVGFSMNLTVHPKPSVSVIWDAPAQKRTLTNHSHRPVTVRIEVDGRLREERVGSGESIEFQAGKVVAMFEDAVIYQETFIKP